jgi:copper chaperone CopZ
MTEIEITPKPSAAESAPSAAESGLASASAPEASAGSAASAAPEAPAGSAASAAQEAPAGSVASVASAASEADLAAAPVVAVYSVAGMSCGHCAGAVTRELSALEGVTGVHVDLESKKVTVGSTRELTDEEVRAAVDEAGYELVGQA